MAKRNKTTKRTANTVGYVDGYVLVVKKKDVARYRKIAKEAGEIWMKHGALGLKECIGDDLEPDTGGYPMRNFQTLVKLKPGETVWFSYIEYTSKKHRDQVNKKVMKEMEAEHKNDPDHMKKMPFEMKQLSFGGFKVAVGF